jgi:vacuolar-type H+-ATPase subunit F/Vma7
MRVRLIGDTQDVTGFALAGIDSQACTTRAELVRALDAACHNPAVAIVMVSAAVAALAGDEIQHMRDSAHLPIAIVLPERSASERAPGGETSA